MLDLLCLIPFPEIPVKYGDLDLHNFQYTYARIQKTALIL